MISLGVEDEMLEGKQPEDHSRIDSHQMFNKQELILIGITIIIQAIIQ